MEEERELAEDTESLKRDGGTEGSRRDIEEGWDGQRVNEGCGHSSKIRRNFSKNLKTFHDIIIKMPYNYVKKIFIFPKRIRKLYKILRW